VEKKRGKVDGCGNIERAVPTGKKGKKGFLQNGGGRGGEYERSKNEWISDCSKSKRVGGKKKEKKKRGVYLI